MTYQPKTGMTCGCNPGQQRDNCPRCEGTGQVIDFEAIRAKSYATHTPTPWHYAPGELIYGPKGETVASCRFVTNFSKENVANMRVIVRAVNAHDDLMSALRDVYESYLSNGEFDSSPWVRALREKVLAALAKAERE